MGSDVPAVRTAMRILESLAAASPRAVSPGELVNEHGLNRSTCYNILATLQSGGWARSLGERAGWTLGPQFLALASGTIDLVTAVVQQELDRLSGELGFVAFVAELGSSGEHVVVAKSERQTGVRVTVGIGDSFPFSAPALMQAACAWLPAGHRRKLLAAHDLTAFTPRTVVEPRELDNVLEAVRQDGFSRSIQQFKLGQGGVAAPVFDHRGRVRQVVCCLAFSSDLNEKTVDHIGKTVRTAADRITQRTGGALPSPESAAERTG